MPNKKLFHYLTKAALVVLMSVTIGNAPAVPMNTVINDAQETYIGRINGKSGGLCFIPVAESPEAEIDHLWRR